MCVSSGLKALNTTVKGILTTAKNEASTVFGAASSVFNSLFKSLDRISTAGPGQAGMSGPEWNAVQAQITQNTAAMARNLKGAAASSAAAIGGGNVVTPGGGTQATVLAADIAAAQEGASEKAQAEITNAQLGEENWKTAVGAEENLPNVYNAATASEGEVNKAAGTALDVQKEMDTNWWQPMVTAAIGGASSMLTGGLMGGGGGGGTTKAFGNASPGQISQMYGGPSIAPTTTMDVPNQIPLS